MTICRYFSSQKNYTDVLLDLIIARNKHSNQRKSQQSLGQTDTSFPDNILVLGVSLNHSEIRLSFTLHYDIEIDAISTQDTGNVTGFV